MASYRYCTRLLLFAFVSVIHFANAPAQTYPAKVVRFVVPFSPGSGSDVVGRIVATGLGEVFGQQVIVENRAGAAGNIGADFVAKSTPDGYTILLLIIGHAANVTLYSKMPYDLVRDFAPITQIGSSPGVVVVHPSLPAKSISELVALAKARPGLINYASGGTGTPTFIAAELFKGQAAIDLLHVPYRSGGEALTSILSGETSVYFALVAAALPQIKQGRLRPLAVTSKKRLSLVPDYPTVAELGYPDYEAGFWHGLAVPVKTSREIINAIRNATISVLNKPNVGKRFTDLGYVAIGSQPEEFAAFIKSEIATLSKVLRGLQVTAD